MSDPSILSTPPSTAAKTPQAVAAGTDQQRPTVTSSSNISLQKQQIRHHSKLTHIFPTSLPFQHCHLKMLQSLYSDTTADVKDDATAETAIPAELWKLILHFLSQTGALHRTQKEASFHSVVHEEASTILEHNPPSSFSAENGHNNNYPRAENNNSGNTLINLTTPTRYEKTSRGAYKRKSHHMSTPRRSGGGGGNGIPGDRHHRRRDDGEGGVSGIDSSWTFVTRLLGKRKKTLQKKADHVSGPFVPLLQVVERRIRELYTKRNDMCTAQNNKHHLHIQKIASTSLHNNNDSSSSLLLLEEQEEDNAYDEHHSKITMKINLWHCLWESLKSSVIMVDRNKNESPDQLRDTSAD